MKKVKSKPEKSQTSTKNTKKINKFISFFKKPLNLTITLLIVGLFIVIYGTSLLLSLNLLIKDVSLVKITTSDSEFFLKNSESAQGEIKVYVSTNPFCKSICEYSLTDLSNGETIDNDSFSTVISNPYSKKYTFTAPDSGEGQKLYRFESACTSKQSGFCKTTEKPVKKSIIIGVNYELNDYQINIRNESIEKLNNYIKENEQVESIIIENEYLYNSLSKKVIINELKENNVSNNRSKLTKLLSDFKHYNYDEIVKADINFSDNIANSENIRLKLEIDNYNNLTEQINQMTVDLINITANNQINETNIDAIRLFINRYKTFLSSFNSKIDISQKQTELGELYIELNSFKSLDKDINNPTSIFNLTNITALEQLPGNIVYNYTTNLSIPLEDPVCCYYDSCEKCCDEGCANDETKYPIILVHGHSFNSAISAEKSLTDLEGIQESLFLDGFVDGGDLILRDDGNSDLFKRTTKRVVFATSYYFDIYKTTDETIILETQSQELSAYAIRLNDIVNDVKLKTGKDKVVIIAHSMGGLVARQYLQIFGDDNVDKLVMIATPNHGIDGKILTSCPIFGEKKHCEDMDKDSLFINKLTYGNVPKIPVVNIIGIGCDMQKETGDGIVKNSSAYLSWANNYYVNGSCNGFVYLHNTILDPEQSPDAYNIIKSLI